MIRSVCSRAVALIILLAATPALSQQYYLYSPRLINPDEHVRTDGGILVQEMVVKKGDTLSGISKRINGRGYYYPQILLFNDIRNPHLIHIGDVLRVPVKSGQIKAEQDRPGSGKSKVEKRQRDMAVEHKAAPRTTREQTKSAAKPKHKQQQTKAPADSTSAQYPAFNKGLKFYKQGDCRSAIEQFDRFLSESPSSTLAADASLYKAECYMKLSVQ